MPWFITPTRALTGDNNPNLKNSSLFFFFFFPEECGPSICLLEVYDSLWGAISVWLLAVHTYLWPLEIYLCTRCRLWKPNLCTSYLALLPLPLWPLKRHPSELTVRILISKPQIPDGKFGSNQDVWVSSTKLIHGTDIHDHCCNHVDFHWLFSCS